ncbi:MAG: hypothetical protein KF809_05475 [Chloroflexi bacterium]|nr:hypothetical protein [Chloroflexota bacterium]
MTRPAVVGSAIAHLRTPVYRNAYALMLSNLLASGLGLVYWTIAARSYPDAVMGASSAAISMLLFLSGAAQLNLRPALLRMLPEAGAGAPRLVARAYLVAGGASLLVGLVVFGGGAIMGSPWETLPELATLPGVLLLAVGTAAWSLSNLQDGALAGLRRTLWVPAENALYAIAKIVALLLLVAALPTLGIVVTWIVPSVAVVVLITILLATRWLPAHVRASGDRTADLAGRRALTFVAADSVGALFLLGSTTLLPVLVVGVAGPTMGAYFAIAWTILTALALLSQNMAASLTVETIHSRDALGPQLRRVIANVYRLLVPLVVAVVVLAEWGLGVFGAAYAESATAALRIGAVGLLPAAAVTLSVAVARIHARPRSVLATQAAVSLSTLGGALVLIGPMGITGVALAWTVAQTLVCLVVVPRELLPALRADA